MVLVAMAERNGFSGFMSHMQTAAAREMQTPFLDGHGRSSFRHAAPQVHRLPPHVMWTITLLTAVCMAMINMFSILAIEELVTWKFNVMQRMINRWGLMSGILALTTISMFYSFIGVCIIKLYAPNCGGSGLPENKCYINGSSMPGFFTRRTLRARIVTNILANAAGFPVGREGPTVVIGSNVAYVICEKFLQPYMREWVQCSGSTSRKGANMVDEERFDHVTRMSCVVGGACGIAMIFNSPFGGVLYMFEEVTSVAWPLELTFKVFVSTTCCAFISLILLRVGGHDIREFVIFSEVPREETWKLIDVPVFVVLAAVLGVITSYHTRWMLAFSDIRQRMLKKWERWQPLAVMLETVLYGGLCALASGFTSLLANCQEEDIQYRLQYVSFNCGEGMYNPIASLLVSTSHSAVKLLFSGFNEQEIGPFSALAAFLTYFVLNVGLTGLPVPGGAFTATMLLGGLFGRFVGGLSHYHLGSMSSASGVYAVVGSAAMLCGFKQMTLASVIIVVQCVNHLSMAPIVMLGVSVAMTVNWLINERGHDEEQIERKKLPFIPGEVPLSLDKLMAGDLAVIPPAEAILAARMSIRDIERALDVGAKMHDFPVVEDCRCIGIVMRSHLSALVLSSRSTSRHRSSDEHPFDSPDHSQLSRVLQSMSREGEDALQSEQSLTGSFTRLITGDDVPMSAIMDPTPFTIMESMPAPRLYPLFAKAGERAVCVVASDGQFQGLISRERLILAYRETS